MKFSLNSKNRDRPASPPDKLIEASPNATVQLSEGEHVELTDEQMEQVSGGRLACCNGKHIMKAQIT